MANTTADLDIVDTAYVDVNTATGIAIGTALTIQNKSNSYMRLAIAASQPDVDTTAYIAFAPDARFPANVEVDEATVWLLGLGPANVQVI